MGAKVNYQDSNADERTADFEERDREDMDRLDLAEQLADEQRDNPPLTEAEYRIDATTKGIVHSAVVLQMQRDALADTLRDISLGAQMMLEPAMQISGTFEQFAREVLRVSRAGLKEAQL